MTFCATIWESNMSIVLISATPQMISAKAMGIPSAIAPSSENVNTATVMAAGPCWPRWRRGAEPYEGPSMLLRFLHRHHVGFAGVAGQNTQ